LGCNYLGVEASASGLRNRGLVWLVADLGKMIHLKERKQGARTEGVRIEVVGLVLGIAPRSSLLDISLRATLSDRTMIVFVVVYLMTDKSTDPLTFAP